MLTPSEIGTLLRTAKRLEQESDRWDSDVMALKAIARRAQSDPAFCRHCGMDPLIGAHAAPARPRLLASNAMTKAR